MKRFLTYCLLVVVFLGGMFAAFYKVIADQYNQYRNSLLIVDYTDNVQDMTNEDYEAIRVDAQAYNRELTNGAIEDVFTSGVREPSPEYMAQLNLNGDGVMGYIDIPKIGVMLPIFHTTNEEGLQKGVGHIEGTSLPVGGETTHCVLAGHRGLPSARLFTDLDQIEEGDLFYLNILDDTLYYRVDQILTVDPDDTGALAILPGEDYVTLVTCTPYGVNTQRLLIRGARVRQEEAPVLLAAQDSAAELPRWQRIVIFAAPVALVGLLALAILIACMERRHRPSKE